MKINSMYGGGLGELGQIIASAIYLHTTIGGVGSQNR